MKIYHIADLLTLTEGLLALLIVALGFFNIQPEVIIFIFAAAEICDALDGPFSRRFAYPNDGKKRWWREYCELTDKATDIMAGASLVAYIIVNLNVLVGILIFSTCLAVGATIQFFIYDCQGLGYNYKTKNPKRALRIVGIRRFFYGLTVFAAIAYLIYETSWIIAIKHTCFGILGIAGIIVLIYKWPRLFDW